MSEYNLLSRWHTKLRACAAGRNRHLTGLGRTLTYNVALFNFFQKLRRGVSGSETIMQVDRRIEAFNHIFFVTHQFSRIIFPTAVFDPGT